MVAGNKKTNRVKAILFDLDGVLIHTMPYHASAWLRTVKKIGVKVTRRKIYEWEGEPGMVTARRFLLWKHGKQSMVTDTAALELLKLKEKQFLSMAHDTHVAPRWKQFLQKLAQSPLSLALVTGTSRDEITRLLPKEVLDTFSVHITGDQVLHGKPHPEPYLKACKQLNIPPKNAVVVENAPYGITSAKEAQVGQIIAIASSLPAEYLHQADIIVSNASQLRQQLLQYV